MAKKMASFSTLSRSSCIIVVVFLCVAMHAAYGDVNKTVLFIFGDSTADVGTNNFLNTSAKANVPYYGIDFPNSEPTGRFSNGFNTIDYIAKRFGYDKSPPPYLALRNNQSTFAENVLEGVNFASGGSGILKRTGQIQWGDVVFLGKQVKQFESVRGSIAATCGDNQTATFLAKALFIISVGSNDLFEFSNKTNGTNFGEKHFLASLQSSYYTHIRSLYALGARKFGIISVAPIGCCPSQRALNEERNCTDSLNQVAAAFHNATEAMLKRLSYELNDFNYSFADSFNMTNMVLNAPLGIFKDLKAACCGKGKENGEAPCYEYLNATLCGNRDDFMFWDWFHPTDKASKLAASFIYGGRSFVTPINFRQLAQI